MGYGATFGILGGGVGMAPLALPKSAYVRPRPVSSSLYQI